MPGVDFNLYLITDRRLCPHGLLAGTVREALEGGVRCIQLREKDLQGAELYLLADELRRLTLRFGARLLINDRLDIALACGADGVHLGVNSLPLREARRLAGESMIIGFSAHDVEEALAAQADGADFVTFGPVFHTPSKASFGNPVGVNNLAMAAGALGIPVFALGGVTLENLEEVMKTGARGIALISAVLTAADPCRMSQSLLNKMEEYARRTL